MSESVALEHDVEIAHQYARDVVAGDEPAGKLVRLACERHLADLDHGDARGLRFDADAGQVALVFFTLLRHSKGEWAGQPFALEPWQQFIVAALFGWKRADGTRRFRTAYVEVARKNGKTTLLAGIGLLLMVADGEPGAEIYAAATKRDQARIVYDEARRMVRGCPSLARRCRVPKGNAGNITMESTASKFEALGADADTLDGLNVHGALIDELHAHPKPDLYEVLETATGARRQPLLVSITTAGSDQTSFCWEMHEVSERVLMGVIDDDSIFAYIAALDEDDDWTDESVWIKANPNLDVSLKRDKLREEVEAAQATPRKQNAVRRLRLNQWTRATTRFLDLKRWDLCAGELMPAEIERANVGRACFAGLDLATTTDVAAFVAVWPPEKEGERWDVACRFFIPGANIVDRTKEHRVPYDQWEHEGWLQATEGDVIDYHEIRETILAFAEAHPITELAFDRWGSTAIANDLQDEGLTMVQFGQGYASMSPPTKDLERLVLQGSLQHGGHPVLRWMADNLEVANDPAGNIKPRKPGHKMSHKKIDGMVALVMALARALHGVPEDVRSVYEERGVLLG